MIDEVAGRIDDVSWHSAQVLIPNHHPSRKSRPFFSVIMWNNQDLLVKQEEVPKDGNWNLGLSFELASSTKKTTTKAKTQNKIEKSSKQIEIYFWSDSDSFVIAKYSTCQILFSSLGDFLPAESESELEAKLFLFTISISIQKKTDNKSAIQYWIQLGI